MLSGSLRLCEEFSTQRRKESQRSLSPSLCLSHELMKVYNSYQQFNGSVLVAENGKVIFPYSDRNATIGSTFVALLAGM